MMICIWHLGLLWEAITILDPSKHVIGMCYAKKIAFDFSGPRPTVGIGLMQGFERRAIYLAWDSGWGRWLEEEKCGESTARKWRSLFPIGIEHRELHDGNEESIVSMPPTLVSVRNSRAIAI